MQPFDSWDNYPPVTERDMKLPWWHERFKAPIFEHEEPVDVQLEGPLSKQLQVCTLPLTEHEHLVLGANLSGLNKEQEPSQ